MNKAKISTIYSNYDLWDNYEKDVRDAFAEEGNDDPSDDAIWIGYIFGIKTLGNVQKMI